MCLKLQDSWRWRNFPLPELSRSKLSPGNPPPPYLTSQTHHSSLSLSHPATWDVHFTRIFRAESLWASLPSQMLAEWEKELLKEREQYRAVRARVLTKILLKECELDYKRRRLETREMDMSGASAGHILEACTAAAHSFATHSPAADSVVANILDPTTSQPGTEVRGGTASDSSAAHSNAPHGAATDTAPAHIAAADVTGASLAAAATPSMAARSTGAHVAPAHGGAADSAAPQTPALDPPAAGVTAAEGTAPPGTHAQP